MTTQRDPEDLFEGGSDRAAYVRQMFGEISHRYDLVNRVMTVGQDQSWRRLAASQIVRPGDTVLDAGTGTGDLAFACLDAGASRVVGIDVAGPMLEQARAKSQKRRVDEVSGFSLGDATRLPLPDASVDAWCSAFVVRNIPDLPAAFSEAYRVLKPGGLLAVVDNVVPGGDESTPDGEAQQAAGAYVNAFELRRDPSHVRCLSREEWRDVLAAAGFTLRHEETAPKRMAFDPWVKRMGADAAAQAAIKRMLLDAPPAAAAFFAVDGVDGDADNPLAFHLLEAIFIAQKPGE